MTRPTYLSTLVIGAILGYSIARLTMERKYILRASNDIADAKEFYERKYKLAETEEKDDLKRVEKASEALRTYQGESPLSTTPRASTEELTETITNKLPTNRLPRQPVNYSVVKPERRPSGTATKTRTFSDPFVISAAVYETGDRAINNQVQLLYHAGDGVVEVMDDGSICSDEYVKENLGDIASQPFGNQSGDPDMIYIRCEQYQTDFEVYRTERKYSEKHEDPDIE